MNHVQEDKRNADNEMPSWREVFLYFLFLGFVNVGGPVAQITMMFNHMVEKRRWLSKDLPISALPDQPADSRDAAQRDRKRMTSPRDTGESNWDRCNIFHPFGI